MIEATPHFFFNFLIVEVHGDFVNLLIQADVMFIIVLFGSHYFSLSLSFSVRKLI